MKGKIKKAAAVLSLAFLLAGCSDASFGADSMLRPPRATGDKAEIQDIITKEAGGTYTLKYPQSGDNRSAIIMRNENTNNEYALALYSTEKDTKLSVSVITYRDNVWSCAGTFSNTGSGIDRVLFKDINGDKNEEIIIGWTSYNSAKKTLTAYSMSTEGVYEMKVDETYDELVIANIVNDKADDIVLLSLSTQDSPSTATLLQYSEEKKRPIGKYSQELDSSVTGFTNILVGEMAVNTANPDGIKVTSTGAPSKTEVSKQESSKEESSKQESNKQESSKQESSKQESSKQESSKQESSKQESSKQESSKEESSKQESSKEESSNPESSEAPGLTVEASNIKNLNKTGIVIDCIRNDHTICTQTVYYDKLTDKLTDPLTVKNSNGTFTNPTVRTDAVYSKDINGDSVIDIPVVSQMMADTDESGANVCTLTSWQNYDALEKKMKTVMCTVMNVKDGYYFIMPKKWNGTVTARSNAETREMTFYIWNSKTSSIGDKLLTLCRFTEQQWEDADKDGLVKLNYTDSTGKAIYAARIYVTSAQDDLNITEIEVNDLFRLI